MALYAFDGTWNLDHEDTLDDTNVVCFRDAYDDRNIVYFPGPGTRGGWLGKLAGGITGLGGRKRVREALKAASHNLLAGDPIIDVVGFSRGAALALHFANSLPAGAEIRFMGLWDCVPSFGFPGNGINLGWKLDMPGNARCVCHAMALDETRYNFELHRLKPNSRLQEAWFPGVHSDVGGGNGNAGLAALALDWMFQHAHREGVRLKSWMVASNKARIHPEAAVSKLKISSKLRKRAPRPDDRVFAKVA